MESSLKRKKRLILVVDDNEDNLQLLTQIVGQFNCEIMTAATGQIALSIAQTHLPDLILLDINLPDISGIAIIHQLKQNPQTSAIQIIAITALARSEDRDRILAAGSQAYISKPYDLDDLENTIHQYLS